MPPDSAPPEPTKSAIWVRSVSVTGDNAKPLISDISFSIPSGAFFAVVGLSGCGKSTLIRALAGVVPLRDGSVSFSGHSVAEIKQEFPLAVGYIPQFGTFHSDLTAEEVLTYAARLRLPASIPPEIVLKWSNQVVNLAKIDSFLDQRFSTLSGGQSRRLALAEELVGDPSFLLLDELTTGLDIFSAGEIMRWLKKLAHSQGKTIILVTHGTEHLDVADGVIFLHGGRLVHIGSFDSLLESQGAGSMEDIFRKYSDPANEDQAPPPRPVDKLSPPPQPLRTDRPPGFFRQLSTLVFRQAKLFSREKGQAVLHLVLIITFPLLVAVFALRGLPEVRAIASDTDGNLVRTLEERLYYMKNAVESASLISALVMFQVVLLTLMGANNGAREIARERDILRKELYAGLSGPACIGSKFLQMVILSILQAAWMAWFVKAVCGFPGAYLEQFAILAATTLAMSTTCLAISAAAPSAERASLLSIYLVGFQLPLSGAALALPDWLADLCRPFIAAYWGWSGYLRTLDSSRYFRLVSDSTKTHIAEFDSSMLVLTAHVVVGLLVAAFFLKQLRHSSR